MRDDDQRPSASPVLSADDTLVGGGEMGRLMRAHDWSRTPLGPIETWSQSLKVALRILLNSRYPMFVWWGPRLIMFHNDAYVPILGKRHPDALGKSGPEVWSEIWADIRPLVEPVLTDGQACWQEERLLVMERNGYTEEAYFTFSYSPIPDDNGGVGGIFCACSEDTQRVLGRRRLRTLREISTRTTEARSVEVACRLATEALADNPHDSPFTMIYLLDRDENTARLASMQGLPPGSPACPAFLLVDSAGEWPLSKVMTTCRTELVDLETKFGALPCGIWPEPPQKAVVLPIQQSGQDRLAGFLIAGLSPRREYDDDYRGFVELIANHIATALANAQAYEEERKRAEALAELDRAKTAFFSNVSHEFRTPLTLMIGPVEDLLADSEDPLTSRQRERLEIAHRNALRLQKLVNTLLDFSRIEEGRVRASYEETDLATLTTELASNFRSACEKAGLELVVDCPPFAENVYVDRDMWEKVVLNLLSNAFKFTWRGRIEVRQRVVNGQLELAVRDTGTGIPEKEVPRLFERFHRIDGTRGRTQEGSGIGLALVRELVRLHGGDVRAESIWGEGSVFTVSLPLGKDHLPADRIGAPRSLSSTALGAAPFVEEALRWLPDIVAQGQSLETVAHEIALAGTTTPLSSDKSDETRPLILLADDNADMRHYVQRLLSDRYEVKTVSDGDSAIQFVRTRRPDLILSDVMMPGLDGFGLLRALRMDPHTQDLPVVLLSARAGEEARVEGLEAGADDYLTKPFSARELLARVGSHLELSRLRRETAEALRDADRRKDEFLATLAHELRNPLAPIRHGLQVLRLAGDNQQMTEQARVMMERQLQQMVRLIDDLMDISRITRNKLELRKERVELKQVIHSALESVQPLIAQQEHELIVNLPSADILVHADATRLAQVFINLLTNAAKYTEPGGRIWLTIEQRERQAIVSVRDTGIGIAAEHLPKVFEMFSQVAPALERSQGGLGIGLALVRGLVEKHGATIEACSAGLGKGSEFVVRIPVLSARDETFITAQPAELAGSAADRRRSVLVVDDNRDSAQLLALMLRLQGHDVYTAHDGLEAIERAESLRPNVVFLDIGLPKLSGYDVCRRIREKPWSAQIVMVALTGWGQDDDRRRSRDAGFDHHFVKPVEAGEVNRLLAEL